MLTRSKAADKKRYIDLLFNEQGKFIALVLLTNEEKNKSKKYVGEIDLESQALADPMALLIKKESNKSSVAPKQQAEKQTKALPIKNLPEFMVIIVPPFGVTQKCVDAIKEAYNVVEQPKLSITDLNFNKSKRSPLVLVSSVEGLDEQAKQCKIKSLHVFGLKSSVST